MRDGGRENPAVTENAVEKCSGFTSVVHPYKTCEVCCGKGAR